MSTIVVLVLLYLAFASHTRAETVRRWKAIAAQLGLTHSPNQYPLLLTGRLDSVGVTVRQDIGGEGESWTTVNVHGPNIGCWSASHYELADDGVASFARQVLDAANTCQIPEQWVDDSQVYLQPVLDTPSQPVGSALDIAQHKVTFIGRSPIAFEAYWAHDATGWSVVVALVCAGPEPPGYQSMTIALYRASTPREGVNSNTACALGTALARTYGVEFYFPSPGEPRLCLPHWWEKETA